MNRWSSLSEDSGSSCTTSVGTNVRRDVGCLEMDRRVSVTRERSVRLSTRFVAGVAQSAERFTRKYLPMNAVLRAVAAGRR